MLLTLARQVATANDGTRLAGAKLYIYQAGTTTTFVTYQDGAFSTPHAQPVVADANGIFPAIHINPASTTNYRLVLKTSADVDVSDDDVIPPNPAYATDLLPKTDNISAIGSTTKRWTNAVISGAYKYYDGTYSMSVQPTALTANRTLTLPNQTSTLATTADVTANLTTGFVYKSSNTSRDTTTTLADDPHLTYAVTSTGVYEIRAYIIVVNATTTTQGFKWNLNYTGGAGSNIHFGVVGMINGSSYASGGYDSSSLVSIGHSDVRQSSGSIEGDCLIVTGLFNALATGTLSFQWAQNSSSANVTQVKANSWMSVTKRA